MTHNKLIKLLSVNSSAAGILFLRNLVVAHHVSVESFGIAATFALVVAIMEMSTDVGLTKYLVKVPEKELSRTLACIHALTIIRNLLASAIIFIFASSIAEVFQTPNVVGSYQLLALLPAIKAIENLEFLYQARKGNFLPQNIQRVTSAVVALVVVLALRNAITSANLMLWSLVSQAAAATLVSWLFSAGPYSARLNKEVFHRTLKYGAPLLLSNVLIFLVLQGERATVAVYGDSEILGVFSLALTLTLAPTTLLSGAFTQLYLPILEEAKTNKRDYERESTKVFTLSLLVAGISALAFVTVGANLADHLYGQKYLGIAHIVGILGVQQTLRTQRNIVAIYYLVFSKTTYILTTNFVRAIFTLIGVYVFLETESISTLIYWAIVGELIALGATLFVVLKKQYVPTSKFTMTQLFLGSTGFAICLSIAAGEFSQQLDLALTTASTALVGIKSFLLWKERT